MGFRSRPLLEKHVEKFCIGGRAASDSLVPNSRYPERQGRQGRKEPRKPETPNDTFHKLRMSLEDAVPTRRFLQPEEETSPWIPLHAAYRQRLADLADSHEYYMADIQARNQRLEEQRKEIQRRLSDLAAQDSSTAHVEQLLLELRAQEGKNQLALDALRDQIGLLQAAGMRSQQEPSSHRTAAGAAEKRREQVSLSLIPLPPASGPLSAEIRALHLAYLQGGGSDPAVLAQLYDLQGEAMVLEAAAGKPERREKKKKPRADNARPLDAELLAVELQNQRLEDELFKLKIQRDKRRADEGVLGRELAELQRAHESMGPQTPALSRPWLESPDALGPAPYDPGAGFAIFYDFLLGLDPTVVQVRLVAGLYRDGQEMGKPTPLPSADCDVARAPRYLADGRRGNGAILATKQPVPRVRPSTSIALVVELQAAGGFDAYGLEIQRLASRGWAKITLFDQLHQVISGRWKIPVRVLPVKPGLTTEQLNGVPQAGKTELYLRVVNARDADVQSLAEIDPGNASLYRFPPTVSRRMAPPEDSSPAPFHPAPASLSLSIPPYTGFVDPPPILEQPVRHKPDQSSAFTGTQESRVQPPRGDPGRNVGFIVDRVKGAPPGDGVLRLTGYHRDTGQVINTRSSGMTFSTTPVRSSIKQGYFLFGEQEVTFPDLLPQEDMVLITRFYHWPSGSVATAPWDAGSAGAQLLLERDAWLAAWAVLGLTEQGRKGDRGAAVWSTGTHDLTLYHGPVPPARALAVLPEERQHRSWEPYGGATVRLHVFSGEKPELPFPPETPVALGRVLTWPRAAFIHHVRDTPATKPFSARDGFRLCIDGARYLPDAATISRVAGRILDSSYRQIGPDISTGIDLNSSIFEPVYNYSLDIRGLAVPPSATLLLKLYSVDRGGRYVPCASLLVRLLPAPREPAVLEGSVAAPWEDLVQPRPDYADGVYYSDTARPTAGESCLFSALANRSAVLVREIVPQLIGNQGPVPRTDQDIVAWIAQKLSRTPDSSPQPFSLTYVSRYLPACGIQVAVDGAWNLPWSGLTLAHFCFNPPGAFYFGRRWLKYDRPVFLEALDLDSYQKWPAWLDGFKSFPQRTYHEHLTVIIHLHEVTVTAGAPGAKAAGRSAERRAAGEEGDGLRYVLGSQAWAALHVFSRGYCNTGVYQLPLYQGAPSQVQLLEGASLVARIADGRREEELRTYRAKDIDQSYLPKENVESYAKEPHGSKVAELMTWDKAETQRQERRARLLILDQI
ncbi:coiled-coil domain-containing protein 17 isoform D [Alligator mississippiensis]|uniref:Coiled-coil domain-containing protein 17 isoform D n=1 Tax=Alligator mississippiensis TaxID=8496 RepID=A0A151PG74_ALLMI|nr:coiled-coil domain-containing protein 17 isoform D [Alligator mississippiensis]